MRQTQMSQIPLVREISSDETYEAICLDTLAEQTQEVLHGTCEDVLQELLALNGPRLRRLDCSYKCSDP